MYGAASGMRFGSSRSPAGGRYAEAATNSAVAQDTSKCVRTVAMGLLRVPETVRQTRIVTSDERPPRQRRRNRVPRDAAIGDRERDFQHAERRRFRGLRRHQQIYVEPPAEEEH